MGKPSGFLEFDRSLPRRRPVPVRLRDWKEVYEPFSEEDAVTQGSRCMDCGIAFCHEACPLGNLIPEWNDLVYRSDWSAAIERLHATNNFPEFTGRLCPAPCEGSCVLGINDNHVTIERIEYEIVERAFAEGWVTAVRATEKTGKSVAVVGSGPAGLAAASNSVGPAMTSLSLSELKNLEDFFALGFPSSRWRSQSWIGAWPSWKKKVLSFSAPHRSEEVPQRCRANPG